MKISMFIKTYSLMIKALLHIAFFGFSFSVCAQDTASEAIILLGKGKLDEAIALCERTLQAGEAGFETHKVYTLLLNQKIRDSISDKTFPRIPVLIFIKASRAGDTALMMKTEDPEVHIYVGETYSYAATYLIEYPSSDINEFYEVPLFESNRLRQVANDRYTMVELFLQEARGHFMAVAGLQPWRGSLFLQASQPVKDLALRYLRIVDSKLQSYGNTQLRDADSYNRQGAAYDQVGYYEKAIEAYTKAIQIEPDFAPAYSNRGDVYNKIGKYDLAILDYNRAIALLPNRTETYTHRGIAYSQKGDYKLAIDDFNIAIRLDVRNFLAYANRGNVWFQLDKFNRAIEDYNKAIEINPNYSGAYSGRALTYQAIGNNEAFCRDLKKACELGDCSNYQVAIRYGECP